MKKGVHTNQVKRQRRKEMSSASSSSSEVLIVEESIESGILQDDKPFSRKRSMRPVMHETSELSSDVSYAMTEQEQSRKVRTFAFELLSRIEMLNAQASSDDSALNDVLSQCKLNVIDYILENSPLDDNQYQKYLALGTFHNLNKLLDTLLKMIPFDKLSETDSDKLKRLIQNHKELITLQKHFIAKLPLTPAQRRWKMLKTYVLAGFSRVFENGNPVLVPEPRHMINLYPLIDTINRVTHPYREAASWLFNNLKILTFKELCASIKESTLSLHGIINELDGYHVITCPGKSQEWMANIASRYLPKDKLPESYEEVNLGCYYKVCNTIKYNNIFMFDDASYSGKQIVDRIINPIWLDVKYSSSFNNVKLFIVFGFVSNFAKKRIEKRIEEVKDVLSVQLVCSHFFSNIEQDIERDVDNKELADKIKELVDIDKTTVLTEWKTPDYVSTPTMITRGIIRTSDVNCFRFTDATTSSQYFSHYHPFDADKERIKDFLGDDPTRDGINPTNRIRQPYSRAR